MLSASSSPAEEQPRLKILVVEPPQPDALAIEDLLSGQQSRNYLDLVRAFSCSQALSLVEQEDFDLCFLDGGLGEGAVMNYLQSVDLGCGALPVILVAAAGQEALARKAVEEGVQEVLIREHLDRAALSRSILYAIQVQRFEETLLGTPWSPEERLLGRGVRDGGGDRGKSFPAWSLLDDDPPLAAIAPEPLRPPDEETAEAVDGAVPAAESPQFRALLSAIEEGVVVVDREGRILECNQKAEAILGFEAARWLGRRFSDLDMRVIREDGSDVPLAACPLFLALSTGREISALTMGLYRGEGDLVWLSVRLQPVFRAGEAEPGTVIASFSDITQQKMLQDYLNRFARLESWLSDRGIELEDMPALRDAEISRVVTDVREMLRHLVGETDGSVPVLQEKVA